jgi:hypothetical protein
MARFSGRLNAKTRECPKCQAPPGHSCRTVPKTADGRPTPGWYPKQMASPHPEREKPA